jgi:hypothetical protein
MLTSTKALRPESGKNDLVQELKSYLKATTTKAAQLQLLRLGEKTTETPFSRSCRFECARTFRYKVPKTNPFPSSRLYGRKAAEALKGA